MKPQGAQVLLIDTAEQTKDLAAYTKLAQGFAGKHHLDMPVLLDIGGKVSDSYSIKVIPTNVIIDPKGIIRYWGEGYNPDAEWKVLHQLGVK